MTLTNSTVLTEDDILFAFCSGPGSQGDKSNVFVTRAGDVYSLSLFDPRCDAFMAQVCPFVDVPQHADCECALSIDWECINLYGAHSLFVHKSVAKAFISAVREYHSNEMLDKWLEVAVDLVAVRLVAVNRFVEAQDNPFCGYETALAEIRNGQKVSHWIWYVFPQLRGLGLSSMARYYGVADRYEAQIYLDHPLLGKRIREINAALLQHKDKPVESILGPVDALKVKSCMTMFNFLAPGEIFGEVIHSFYNGECCEQTLKLMSEK